MKQIYLMLFIWAAIKNIYAQDPNFVHTYENRLFLNPALCSDDSKLRFSYFNRNLYRPIKGPFSTNSFSLEYPLCGQNIAFGLSFLDENQGDGFLRSQTFNLGIACHFKLGVLNMPKKISSIKKNSRLNWLQDNYPENWFLFLGLSGDAIQNDLNWDNYIFSDQLHPIYGNINASANQNLLRNNELGIGYNGGVSILGVNYNETFFVDIGASLFHPFNTVKIGIIKDYELPYRMQLHLRIRKKKQDNEKKKHNYYQLILKYDQQSNFRNILINPIYYLNDLFSIGIGYKGSFSSFGNSHSPLINLSLELHDNFLIKGAYEISTNGLNVMGAGNTFELGLNFEFEKKCRKSSKSKRNDCPKF